MLGSWAAANPDRVAGLAGIYPVFDFRSYPGLDRAAPAYGLTAAELDERAAEFNPVARASLLARAGVPAFLLHGDVDTVVPLPANSGAFATKYGEASAAAAVKLVVLPRQGHNMFEGFFRSQELVDFVIAKAREGGNR
jgi:pimeloyl-ACP methyl ester carboxylesterase